MVQLLCVVALESRLITNFEWVFGEFVLLLHHHVVIHKIDEGGKHVACITHRKVEVKLILIYMVTDENVIEVSVKV